MKKIIFLILCMLSSLAAQNNKLTLKESLDIGLKNSKDLTISQSRLTSSSAVITSVSSQMLPQLSFSAGYIRLSSVPPAEVTVPFSPAPIKISDVVFNNYALKLSLQQPLFTGFRLSSLKSAASSNYQAAQKEYVKDINDAAFKIQNTFWNYYKAEQNKKIIKDNLELTKKHLEDTRNFLANGLVTRNDLLKLEVQYSNAKLQLIDAENNLEIARIAFNQAIGIPLDSPTEIDAKEIQVEKNNYTYAELTSEAKQHRPELEALRYRVQAGKDQVRAANSGWFPSIYLTGNYYYSRPNQRYFPTQDKFKDSWDVGVALSWNLWNWGLTSSQVTIAEQSEIQTETALSQLNDAVDIEVYKNLLTLNKAYEKVEVSRLNVKQAEENYRITQEQYNTQVISSTDLINAEVAMLAAKTNLNTTMVNYEMAKVSLEKSLGRKIY